MINRYTIKESNEWDSIILSFSNYDVYYLSGYVRAFYIHGDGEPELMYYEGDGIRAIYVYMKRKIAEGIYDAITPYGYGGVLFDGDITEKQITAFYEDYLDYMHTQNIIDNFVRYHPVLRNALKMKQVSTVNDLGKTIALDISDPDRIWSNIISKNRNVIRKAEKNGVEILHSKNIALFGDFMKIYNATMDHDYADKYYYFKEDFYKSIYTDLNEHFEMFYAVYKEKIIAMSIILFANNQMHYHLSGSLFDYRNLAPTNLLLYKAALWGNQQGFKTFHLGGGVGSGKDNLYKFKAAFNRNSDYQFSIGKEIFDKKKYEDLVLERKNRDSSFNMESTFFPLYRA